MNSPGLVRHACALVLIGLMGAALLAHVRQLEIQVDESAWITSGHITYGLVTDLAPPVRWESAYNALGSWGNMNPPVGKLLIGFMTAAVVNPDDTVAYSWDWGQTAQWNEDHGRLPPPHVLHGVRSGMVVLGTICLLLAYLIAVQLVGPRWIALWAPVALFLNPGFRAQSATVYTGVPQLLCLLLACWLFNRFLVRKSWIWLVSAAIAIGLACAVKFNSAPFLLAACLFAWPEWTEVRRRLIAALGTLMLVFVTFVAVNPYLYPDPLRRTRAIIEQWSGTLAEQQADVRLASDAVTSRVAATRLVLKRAIVTQDSPVDSRANGPPAVIELFAFAVLALVLLRPRGAAPVRPPWRAMLPWLILLLGSVITYGLLYRSFGGACLVLILAGVIGVWRSGAELLVSSALFIGVVFGAFAIGISLWLPFDWMRYYLPVSVWIPMLQVLGLATIDSAIDRNQRRGVRS